jgi:alkanesulfonate monooxygenase SsuD/methylene tetrahydromethanopterin reductase-like flavin-dependent oxidoreductase (luciferase family)
MMGERAEIGMCFDRTFAAGAMPEYARRAEAAGIQQLWVIEDCFYTAGVSLAATALAVTESLQVGIGIMPAVARNPAITAMEIATLCNIAPGRFIPGIGHGLQNWMQQMGARTPSPLTTLDETITVVKRLLAGEEVSFDGREVTLDAVQLDQPPSIVPPVIAGVQQHKSMAVAGRVADGVLLVEGAGPAYVSWSLDHAGRPDDFHVATFTMMAVADTRREAYGFVAPLVAEAITERRPAYAMSPFCDDMAERVSTGGPEALLDMPADYWAEIGAIGTFDDALAHVAALEAAGVNSINIFPADDIEIAWEQMEGVAALAAR